MLLARTNPPKLNFRPLQTPKMSKKVDIFSQNLVLAWYFMVFLVRTSYTAADTLIAGALLFSRGRPVTLYALGNLASIVMSPKTEAFPELC